VDKSADAPEPRSVIILCEVADGGALWAASELQIRGTRCEIIFGSVLGAAPRIDHGIDAHGRSDVQITFPDGRQVSSATPSPILNRLMAAPIDRLRATGGEDFGYAMQEVYALHLSWLHSWPATIINRPTPQGLCGYFRHPSAWVALASQAGLLVSPWHQSDVDGPELAWGQRPVDARAFVVGDRVVLPPELPKNLAEPCSTLGLLAGSTLLGIDFARQQDGEWLFVGASPIPILQGGGAGLADALADALK
jgi:hypothetical protein